MQAVKFLHVTVPCSFKSHSNMCINEATGWSPCRAVLLLHPPAFLPHYADHAPVFHPLHDTPNTAIRRQTRRFRHV